MMYMVIGYVTEVLGNKRWETLVTSKVLEKVGMTSSKVLTSSMDLKEANVAKPYIYRDEQFLPGDINIYKYCYLTVIR